MYFSLWSIRGKSYDRLKRWTRNWRGFLCHLRWTTMTRKLFGMKIVYQWLKRTLERNTTVRIRRVSERGLKKFWISKLDSSREKCSCITMKSLARMVYLWVAFLERKRFHQIFVSFVSLFQFIFACIDFSQRYDAEKDLSNYNGIQASLLHDTQFWWIGRNVARLRWE